MLKNTCNLYQIKQEIFYFPHIETLELCHLRTLMITSLDTMLFIPGKPSVEQASIRMVSSVILVHWCNDVLVLPYLWSMDVIEHKYESAYHLY